MNQAQECLVCLEKDELIHKLMEEIIALKFKLETYEPTKVTDSVVEEFRYTAGMRNEMNKTAFESFFDAPIGFMNQQSMIPMVHSQQNPQLRKGHTLQMDDESLQIGQKFFEHFMILGPDFEEIDNLDPEIKEISVKPKKLYQFPPSNSDQYDIIPYYAYPNNVQIKKLVATPDNDIIMPALKQIVMQTLQPNKSNNEFVFTVPREDLMEKKKKKVTQFVQESNPNTFRYIICFEIDEFYCKDPTSNSCWLCPIIHCFVSYFPFIKFFMKENAEIWNTLKLERLQPLIINNVKAALSQDLNYIIQNMNKVLERLFTLRSFQVDFDKKYDLTDTQIKTPKRDRAKFIQFQWGATKTFQLFTFKELIVLLTHLLLSQRLLLFSKSKATLSHVMMTLISLIQPFNYLMPLCFLLPNEFIDKIGAPNPIFFGIQGEYLNYAEQISEIQSDDVTFIDIDSNQIYYSKDQSRDNLEKLTIPFKKNPHLKHLYQTINPSKENHFSKKNKRKKSTKPKKQSDRVQNNNVKENEIEILKIIQNYWYQNLIHLIPLSKKFLRAGRNTQLDLPMIQEHIVKQCNSESKQFIAEFIQQPTFTGFLDEMYEKYFEQHENSQN